LTITPKEKILLEYKILDYEMGVLFFS